MCAYPFVLGCYCAKGIKRVIMDVEVNTGTIFIIRHQTGRACMNECMCNPGSCTNRHCKGSLYNGSSPHNLQSTTAWKIARMHFYHKPYVESSAPSEGLFS